MAEGVAHCQAKSRGCRVEKKKMWRPAIETHAAACRSFLAFNNEHLRRGIGVYLEAPIGIGRYSACVASSRRSEASHRKTNGVTAARGGASAERLRSQSIMPASSRHCGISVDARLGTARTSLSLMSSSRQIMAPSRLSAAGIMKSGVYRRLRGNNNMT